MLLSEFYDLVKEIGYEQAESIEVFPSSDGEGFLLIPLNGIEIENLSRWTPYTNGRYFRLA